MKIILSHDVDHLHWDEHLADTYIPGLLFRSSKALFLKKLSLNNYINRFNPFRNLHNLHGLVKTLHKHQVPATFFFGMSKGLNLSYSNKKASPLIQWLDQEGFEIGVHGINYQHSDKMEWEKAQMTKILGREPKGIRNHYLRHNHQTFHYMAHLRYSFDSTDYGIKSPYKIGSMWEIPISIMDVEVWKSFSQGPSNLNNSIQNTLIKVEEAKNKNLPYFIVNFHDVYYSEAYPIQKEWFDWLLDYFKENGFKFISFSDAVDELNRIKA